MRHQTLSCVMSGLLLGYVTAAYSSLIKITCTQWRSKKCFLQYFNKIKFRIIIISLYIPLLMMFDQIIYMTDTIFICRTFSGDLFHLVLQLLCIHLPLTHRWDPRCGFVAAWNNRSLFWQTRILGLSPWSTLGLKHELSFSILPPSRSSIWLGKGCWSKTCCHRDFSLNLPACPPLGVSETWHQLGTFPCAARTVLGAYNEVTEPSVKYLSSYL